jgi:uncharacterized protein with von Willebrand factor type A (vWA) domain
MTQTDAQKKSQLAKLLATENIIVQENAVPTASFDVKSRILTLPIFKEEQKSKHVYDYLVGHEVSHALHTPNKEWADMKGRSKEFRSFVNVLEDIRIDKLIQKKYPGLKKDYQLGFKKMYKDNFFGTKGIDIQNKYCLIDKINLYFKSSKTLPITFSSKEKILVNACDQTKTFKDVLTLAEEILGYCKEELKKNPKLIKTYVPVSKPKEDIDTGEEDKNPDVKTGDINEDVEKWLKKKEDESKEDESGSNNEDKKNTDKDKEKDKDNAQGNPTGAGGDVPITSQTNNAFDEAMHQQVDSEASKRNYVVLPKVYMKNLIVDYKTFIKDNLLNDSKEQDDSYKSGNLKSLEQTKQFIRDSNNVVNYLVKEFEMKKNARLHARSATAKTGIIDPLKLHSYKFAEDIFKKMTIIPNEKNHGMIFLLDWSGSMQKHLLPTVEQLINLVLFVRKINIPFSVYKFINNHDNEDPHNPPFDNVEGKVIGDQSTKLVRLYTHKQTKSDFMSVTNYLHRMAKYWSGGYGAFGRHYNDDWVHVSSPVSKYYLCSTPLNESLIAMDHIIPKFRNDYKSDKVALVTLTDGGANSMKNSYCGDLWVKLGKNHVKCKSWSNDKANFTNRLLKYLKKKHNIKTIGFYLVSKFRDLRYAFRIPYGKEHLAKKMFLKDKCIPDLNTGYDVYFYVRSDTKVKNQALTNEDTTNKRTLKKMFMKGMKGRITSRVLLSKFIKEVA